MNFEVFDSLRRLALTSIKFSTLLFRAVLQAVSAVDGLGTLVVDTDLFRGIFDGDFTLEQRDQIIALLIVNMSIIAAHSSLHVLRGRHALGLLLWLQHRD